ncbi:F-box domain-containing protein [Colletotrichum eremochloae]|nr:F-box domain-containing protein [Colletotrichum eremochloae]
MDFLASLAPLASQAPGHTDPGTGGSNRAQLVTLPRELIIEIAKLLEADPDAKVSPLSLVNRTLRDLSIPSLFRTMQLTTTEDDLLEHIDDIHGNRAILDCVFILGIYSEGSSTFRTPYQNVFLGYGENCKRGTAAILADLIFDIPHLTDLRLDLRFKANTSLIGPLRRTFKQQYMSFHVITALSFPMKTDIKFIPEVFPNLTALSLELHKAPDVTPDLVYISQHLELEYLELWKARWGPGDFVGIPTLFPNIKSLTIGGMIALGSRLGTLPSLPSISNTLRQLPNLRVLAISNESFCNRQTRNVKAFDRSCRIRDKLARKKKFFFLLDLLRQFLIATYPDFISSSTMNTVNPNTLATFGKPTAPGVASPAKTFLVTLPRELIIEIIRVCHDSRPDRGQKHESRDRGIVVRLSCVNKCLRILCIPFVFQNLRLSTMEVDLDAHIQAIVDNNAILEAARCLFLKTCGPESCLWDHFGESPPVTACGPLTPALLVKILSKMSLEGLRLEFVNGKKSLAKLFAAELAAQRMALPSVTFLAYPHPMMVEFIPTVFPNLRVLSLTVPKNWSDLTAIASELHYLNTLELREKWSLYTLRHVLEIFPSIRRLLIDSKLMRIRVSDLISILKTMPNLKDLSFLGGNPVDCWDPFFGKSHDFALEFFKQCPRLEKLTRYHQIKVYRPVRQENRVIKVEVAEATEELKFSWNPYTVV